MRSFALLLAGVLLLAWGAFSEWNAEANHSNDLHNTDFGSAVYDRRLPPEVVRNEAGNIQWRVGAFSPAAEGILPAAVTEWNQALAASPNALNKTPLGHLTSYNYNTVDSTVTVEVHDDVTPYCGAPAQGCMVDDNDIGNASGSDLIERPFHIFIDADDSDDILYTLKHELGHVLFHEEHYASFPFGACDTDWASIMNQFNCLGNLHVSPHDAVDFFGAYQPKDSPKPASMSPSSSSAVQFTWSSAESTRHNLSRYLSQKLSDRNGTLLVETVSNAIPEFGTVTGGISYSIGTSGGTISRFCVRTAGTTNAGYQGLSALTPFTPHGCASRSLSPYPTSFIATSEVSSSGSAIVTRLRNGASATRYFQITGPGLENLGSCSNVPYRTVGANGGTNNCSISYGTADNHDRLAVFVWNSSSGGTLIAAITLDTDAK